MKHFNKTLRNEKGIAVPMVAVALVVLVGFTGLGVEIGRLGLVADEVQNAADIAATAGALQVFQPWPEDPFATPRDHAVNLIGQNKIGGTAVSDSNLTVLETGNYAAGTFTANIEPINAVHAEVEYTVNNLVFAGFGHPTTVVKKESIAAFNPTAGGRPTLPLAIGECLLGDQCQAGGGCDVTLTQIPNPDDNSGWTGFFETASAAEIAGFFPSECEGDDPSTVPLIKVGDHINLLNGEATGQLLKAAECMLEQGLTEVVVPITTCGGSLNQSRAVLGFATFEIVAVRRTGGNKGIDVRGLTNANEGPGGDGEDFGSGTITMVR